MSINVFEVHPLSKYRNQSTQYQQPAFLASYSYDNKRNFHFDARSLKYYHKYPLQGKSLSEGYETAELIDEEFKEHLDALLQSILELKELNAKSHDSNNPKNPHVNNFDVSQFDIVTWRGLLALIICTPYNRIQPWELAVSKYKNVLYIEHRLTEQEVQKRTNETPQQKLMCYWGFKFEQYATSSSRSPLSPELRHLNDQTPVNNFESYCIVAKTKYGKNRILFGAEVDCTDPAYEDPSKCFIELKTTKTIDSEKANTTFFKFKMLKFWAQSFLGNVPKIIIGFRNDDGIIQSVEEYETLKIPKSIPQNYWDSSVCLNFGNQLLEWLKQVVTIDDPKVTYIVKYDDKTGKITSTYIGDTYSFIPSWYIDGIVGKKMPQTGDQKASEDKPEEKLEEEKSEKTEKNRQLEEIPDNDRPKKFKMGE